MVLSSSQESGESKMKQAWVNTFTLLACAAVIASDMSVEGVGKWGFPIFGTVRKAFFPLPGTAGEIEAAVNAKLEEQAVFPVEAEVPVAEVPEKCEPVERTISLDPSLFSIAETLPQRKDVVILLGQPDCETEDAMVYFSGADVLIIALEDDSVTGSERGTRDDRDNQDDFI